MNERTKTRIRERARNRCEYCQLTQEDSPLASLCIEHVIPKIHGGTDDFENLALACIDCNLHKGPNLTGVDPQTKKSLHSFTLDATVGISISNGTAFTLWAKLRLAVQRFVFSA